jgi:hypothetical protein
VPQITLQPTDAPQAGPWSSADVSTTAIGAAALLVAILALIFKYSKQIKMLVTNFRLVSWACLNSLHWLTVVFSHRYNMRTPRRVGR